MEPTKGAKTAADWGKYCFQRIRGFDFFCGSISIAFRIFRSVKYSIIEV